MGPIGVKLTEEQLTRIDRLAQEHNTSRSAILRSVVDNGLRAPKYYPDEFDIDPDRHEQLDAVELTKQGQIDR